MAKNKSKSNSGSGSIKKRSSTNSNGTKKHPIDVLKKTTKSLGDKAKKQASKIKNLPKKAIHKSVEAAEFMALKPFEPVMKLALKRKNINVPHKAKLKLVASLFVTNVIAKKDHLDFDVPNDFQHMDMLNHLNALEHVDSNPDAKQALADAAEETAFKAATTAAGIVPGGAAATGIVHLILDYFKGVQRKKKANEAKKKIERELIAKGETKEQAEKDAQNQIDKDPEFKLTVEEKKFIDPKEPLTEEEKETATGVDKTHDQLATILPGTENSEGETVVKDTYKPWWVGFWSRLFSHHATKTK